MGKVIEEREGEKRPRINIALTHPLGNGEASGSRRKETPGAY